MKILMPLQTKSLRLLLVVFPVAACGASAKAAVEAVAYGIHHGSPPNREEDRASSPGDPISVLFQPLYDYSGARAQAAAGRLGGESWDYSDWYRETGGEASYEATHWLTAGGSLPIGTWVNLRFDLACSGQMTTSAQGIHDGLDHYAYAHTTLAAGFTASAIHEKSVSASVSYDASAYRDHLYYDPSTQEYDVLYWEGEGDW
jgi:hypothetical protein